MENNNKIDVLLKYVTELRGKMVNIERELEILTESVEDVKRLIITGNSEASEK
jgi:hypothetical protein